MADSVSPEFDPTRSIIVLQSGRSINLDPQVQTPMTLEAATRPLMLQHIPETFHDALKKDGKGLTGERAAIAWEVFQDRMMQGESEAQALSTTRKLFGLEKMDAQTLSTLQETGALVTRPDAPELMSPITAEEAKAAAAQVGKPEMLPSGPRISSMEMLDVVLIQNGKTLDALMAKQEALGNHQKEEIQYELDNGGFFSLAPDGTLTLFHKDGQTQNLTRFSPLNINTLGDAEPQKDMNPATPQQGEKPSTGQYVPPPPVKVAPSDLPPGSMIGVGQQGGFSAANGFNPPPANAPPGTHQFAEPFVTPQDMQPKPASEPAEESRKKMQDALGPKGQRLTPEQMREYTPGQPREEASTGAPEPITEVLAKNGIKPGMTFSEIAASTMFQSQYSPVGDPRKNPQKGRGMS